MTKTFCIIKGKAIGGNTILSFEWENLGLIDLISERYLQLRGISNQLWSETSDISISNSEWLIMARTYKKETDNRLCHKGCRYIQTGGA